MDLKPGTPEYQEAYDKEMKRLEAVTTDSKDEKVETTTSAEKTEKVEKPDPVTKADVEKLEKALKDTQRWAHQNAAEVSRLKKEAEERKRTETRPEILNANPGLEDAIKYVAPALPQKSKDDIWMESVQRAIPDIDGLLNDQAFLAKAKSRQAELGEAWMDPLIAIREFSDLKTVHVRDQAIQGAVEQARKDFEDKSTKRSAMSVPGGSGAKQQPQKEDEAQKIREMSSKDFNAMRAKVMGFTM